MVTHQTNFEVPGVVVVNSIGNALQLCEETSTMNNESFVIGGETLYRQTLKLCQRMYITEIQKDFEGDAFFPEFNINDWQETQRDKHFSENDPSVEYHFVILDRKT